MEVTYFSIWGAFCFRNYEEKIDFFFMLIKHLKSDNARKYHNHFNEQPLRQKMYQMIAAYAVDAAADQFTADI